MASRILLTGANGFVGKVLTPMLVAAGHEVICASLSDSTFADTKSLTLDICDPNAVLQAVKEIQPTHLLHLAAISHVPTSFKDPRLTWQTNVMGTIYLLEAIKQYSPKTFFQFISSSEVYGKAFKVGHAVSEDTTCIPMNPYAASKRAAELATQQYFQQGVNGVIVRPFNHIGPGQSPDFVTAAFAKQIASIEAGLQPPVIKVGNLTAHRDFLDVRDVCYAYLKLLDLATLQPDQTTFNIASGKAHKIDDVLTILLQQSTMDIQVEQDPERLRPSDIPIAIGNYDHLQKLTGWQPQYSFVESLTSLLDYWRTQVKMQ